MAYPPGRQKFFDDGKDGGFHFGKSISHALPFLGGLFHSLLFMLFRLFDGFEQFFFSHLFISYPFNLLLREQIYTYFPEKHTDAYEKFPVFQSVKERASRAQWQIILV